MADPVAASFARRKQAAAPSLRLYDREFRLVRLSAFDHVAQWNISTCDDDPVFFQNLLYILATSSTMGGTVLLTGANGSLGVYMVNYLLQQYPDLTLVLTVRNDSDQDISTVELRRILSQYSNATAIVRKLDLSSLDEVAAFSKSLQTDIDAGKMPRLKSIICNAMSWKLSGGPAYSKDGYEMTIAVNHLAHFALSLRLLGSMDLQHGRIVFLGSEAHWPVRAAFSKGFPTHVPEDMNLLVHPHPDEKSQEMGRGFQRYGTSKLVITMVMYELSRRLKQVRCRLD